MLQEMYISLSPNHLDAPWMPKEFPIDAHTARFLLYTLAGGEGRLPKGFSAACQSFPAYCLIHVKSGDLQFQQFLTQRPHVLHMDVGGVYFIDCRSPYKLEARGETEYEILLFGGSGAECYAERLCRETDSDKAGDPKHLEASSQTLFRLKGLTDIAGESDSLFRHKMMTDLLTGLVTDNSPMQNNVPHYLKRIKNRLDTEYKLSHDLNSLEEDFQVNRYRICRDFKQYYQTSPMQYLHQVRMDTAKVLLRSTSLKIHEIGSEVGYENVNHFIYHFKKATDTTPADYRQHK
jgi:AraC-like DNA-binding protein